MITPKKKLCSGCQTLQILWKANPPLCKNCNGKIKGGHLKKSALKIKQKPKPRIGGKLLHTAIYLAKFGYGDEDYIPSEISGNPCVDVHHVDCKGAGSSKNKDRIENLMGLTREEHEKYGDKKQYMSFLYKKHLEFMVLSGVKFDSEWIENEIDKYEGLT